MRDIFDIARLYSKTTTYEQFFCDSPALEKDVPGAIISLNRGRISVSPNATEEVVPYTKELVSSSKVSTLLSGAFKKNIGTIINPKESPLEFDSDNSWVQQPITIWENQQFLEQIKDDISKEDYRFAKKMFQDFLDTIYPGVIDQAIKHARKEALEKAASIKSDKKRAEKIKEIKQQKIPVWDKEWSFTVPAPLKKIREEISFFDHPDQTVAFEYNGKPVYDHLVIRHIVEERYRQKLAGFNARVGECPICGKNRPLVTDSNGFIDQNLIGGSVNGCAFNTFNNPQFLSYGLSKEESGCMCAECGRKITDGWNILLGVRKVWVPQKESDDEKKSKKIGRYEFIEPAFRVSGYNGDYAIVAFATDENGKPYQITDTLNEINDYSVIEQMAPPNNVKRIFKSINTDDKVSVENILATVYIVAPNMARLAIHRRFNMSFKQLLDNINTWKEASKCIDVEYVDGCARKYMFQPKVVNILRVLGAFGKKGAFYSSVSDTVWSMILGGLRTDRNFLNQAINEIRSDYYKSGEKYHIYRNTFATLRFAYNAGKKKEDWMKAELNEKSTDPCYQFGRLLAVSESLVYFANDKKNDMISALYDRCVENPVGALGDLESKVRYYYQKGLRGNRASAVQVRYNQFSEIISGIVLELRRMSQEDRAQFIAGFHQQRIANRTKKSEPLVSEEE